ncbi:thioredoxin [Natronoglycomyces albus]|uniref:Thioredoxin n=1 Tax=Natronoglycomyces albus TaxID=2811108 RepID=A0A895XEF7_9ACTN|nr:thioredoxin [Natronoglycomyces albus]QSB04211.1 thioredoxin [Natronoglycomyces albus]
MATIDLTKETFKDTIEADGIVLVDYWAQWCGPCRQFAPTFQEVSDNHEDIVFAKVDTEAEPEIAAAVNIQSIPTLMVFRDGILVFAQPGALPKEALEDLISQARKLDMDDVRAQVAAEEAGRAQS